MKELEQYREQINSIDNELVALFVQRMELSGKIAAYKEANNIPVLDSTRERELLNRVSELAGEELERYTRILFSMIMDISRSYQHMLLHEPTTTSIQIESAVQNTPALFPEKAVVACQGTEGAYSQLACDKLFTLPNIMFFNTFDSVFHAVSKGLCRYGVLPIENSTAGSVTHIYDLMQEYHFSIVRSTRLKIDHSLLAKHGTSKEDIREIFSHEQAIRQCNDFLKAMPNVKITVCENTAMAAKMVSESTRTDVAAISSKNCAELYNLASLQSSIQDSDCNFTRFICISKQLEIYPGADRTSIMIVAPHKPGSLYKVMSKFFALGINLTKLESRPIPGRDFEFMFYFDIDVSVYSPAFLQLIGELEVQMEEFQYLGSYTEIVS